MDRVWKDKTSSVISQKIDRAGNRIDVEIEHETMDSACCATLRMTKAVCAIIQS
jgi:hypothetical protein